jgi:tetratricopeptide (TPR) repeat protein
MKETLLLISLFLTTITFAQAQIQSSASQEAAKASAEAVKLFGQKKYDEAFPFAQKAVELRESELGAVHLETARAYRNLGFVQLGRGKKDEAGKAFDKAVEGFEKNANLEKKDSLVLAELLEYLGALRFQQEKYQAAEKLYERAVVLREKFNGSDAQETLGAIWSLGNLKRSNNEFNEAAALYRRVYENRIKTFGAGDAETHDAYARYRCALIKNGNKTQAEALKNDFDVVKNNSKRPSTAAGQIIDGGIVTRKAINLARPPFTEEARSRNFSGKILVEIVIGEDGTVLHACAYSDNAPISQIAVVEQAALQSTFKPTTIDGKPVKVSGVVVYNFSR